MVCSLSMSRTISWISGLWSNDLPTLLDMNAVLTRNHANPEDGTLASDWILVTNNQAVLENASVKVHSEPLLSRPDLRTWTDGYNNLLQILKTPSIRASSGKEAY